MGWFEENSPAAQSSGGDWFSQNAPAKAPLADVVAPTVKPTSTPTKDFNRALSMPGVTTPEKTWFEKTKELATKPLINALPADIGDTPYNRSVEARLRATQGYGVSPEQEAALQTMPLPTKRVGDVLEERGGDPGTGVARGLGRTAAGLTSPVNLAMLTGMGSLPKMARAGVGGLFTAEQVMALPEQARAIKSTFESPESTGGDKAQAVTEFGASLAMGALGGKATLHDFRTSGPVQNYMRPKIRQDYDAALGIGYDLGTNRRTRGAGLSLVDNATEGAAQRMAKFEIPATLPPSPNQGGVVVAAPGRPSLAEQLAPKPTLLDQIAQEPVGPAPFKRPMPGMPLPRVAEGLPDVRLTDSGSIIDPSQVRAPVRRSAEPFDPNAPKREYVLPPIPAPPAAPEVPLLDRIAAEQQAAQDAALAIEARTPGKPMPRMPLPLKLTDDGRIVDQSRLPTPIRRGLPESNERTAALLENYDKVAPLPPVQPPPPQIRQTELNAPNSAGILALPPPPNARIPAFQRSPKPVEAAAPVEVIRSLQNATRQAKIGGELSTHQDPISSSIARAISSDPSAIEELGSILNSAGTATPVFLSSGFDHAVLDLGNGSVLRLGPLGTSPDSQLFLKPSTSRLLNGKVGAAIYPKLDTSSITPADVALMSRSLKDAGWDWDPGADNLGRTASGELKVLDSGGARRITPKGINAPVPPDIPIERFHNAYSKLAGDRYGQAITLADIQSEMGITDKIEFTRLLEQLDRGGQVVTKSGARMSLPASTGTRDSGKTYRSGDTSFYGIQFTPPEAFSPQAVETPASVEAPAVEGAGPSVVGRRTPAKVSRGYKVDTEYAAVPMESLRISNTDAGEVNPNYPAELQPRQRDRKSSEEQINRIVSEFDPDQIAENYLASDGAPIIGNDFAVESGNGRSMAIRRIYERHPEKASMYRDWMVQNADRFGLDQNAVSGIKDPVLVRVRKNLPEGVSRTDFGRDANERTTQGMSPAEQSSIDAKGLDHGIIDLFIPNESGDINTSANAPFVQAFIDKLVPVSERNTMRAADHRLSTAGERRIQNAIFAKAYNDRGMIERMAEDPDDNIKSVVGAMVSTAPRFISIKAAIEKGDLHNLDISKDLTAAASTLSNLRAEGKSINDHLNQVDMFGRPELQDAILATLRDLGKSKARFGELLNQYADAVEAVGSPKQEGMFGPVEPPSPLAIWASIVERE